MIKFILSFFKTDPAKKISKQIDSLYEKSVEMQRNGNLREYSKIMAQISKLEAQYCDIKENEE